MELGFDLSNEQVAFLAGDRLVGFSAAFVFVQFLEAVLFIMISGGCLSDRVSTSQWEGKNLVSR